jgi:hypothetical protein
LFSAVYFSADILLILPNIDIIYNPRNILPSNNGSIRVIFFLRIVVFSSISRPSLFPDIKGFELTVLVMEIVLMIVLISASQIHMQRHLLCFDSFDVAFADFVVSTDSGSYI